MDTELIFKIASVGLIVAILNLILKKTDRDEQALMITIAGIIVVLMMLIPALNELINTLKSVFGVW